MTGQMRTSSAGLDLIRSFEGFRETSVRLPDGRWTIGHGHVRTAREGVRISEADALDLLTYDVKPVEEALGELLYATVNQNQIDALVSLAFNISLGQFRESEVLRALNAGDEIAAAAGFDGWRKARVNGRMNIVDALVRRRAVEKALFLEPVEGRPSAPTPIVTPIFDTGSPASVMRGVSDPEPYQADPVEGDEVDDGPAIEAYAPDIARAVADLADRLGPSEARRSPLRTAVAEPQQQNEEVTNSPSRIAAQRLSKILSRVEGAAEPSASRKLQTGAEQSRNDRALDSAYKVPEDLPSFRGPAHAEPKAARHVAIDDTEIVQPHGSVDDLFARGVEEERLVNQRQAQKAWGESRVWALAPWFAIATLCALGLGVAIVESGSAGNANNLLGGAAPTMIAVFGLVLAMSGYYIVTRLSDED